MSEATGFVYDPITGARTGAETVQGQLARNQTLMQLAQALGGLSPERIAALFGNKPTTTTTTTSGGTTTPGGSGTQPKEGERKRENGVWYTYKGGRWVEDIGGVVDPLGSPGGSTQPVNTQTTNTTGNPSWATPQWMQEAFALNPNQTYTADGANWMTDGKNMFKVNPDYSTGTLRWVRA